MHQGFGFYRTANDDASGNLMHLHLCYTFKASQRLFYGGSTVRARHASDGEMDDGWRTAVFRLYISLATATLRISTGAAAAIVMLLMPAAAVVMVIPRLMLLTMAVAMVVRLAPA